MLVVLRTTSFFQKCNCSFAVSFPRRRESRQHKLFMDPRAPLSRTPLVPRMTMIGWVS